VEQRAYNLRPRKDDSVTIQRRSEFARLRQEQQNQRRNKRKEEISAYEEFSHNNVWKNLDLEALPETSDNDLEDISKCSTLFFLFPHSYIEYCHRLRSIFYSMQLR